MSGFLADKVIAVTGAGRGIGRAVAVACAAEGAKVVVNDYGVSIDGQEPSSEIAEAVVAEIEAAGGTAVAIADNIATMEAGERLVSTAVERFGRLDGVVTVAGILRERMLFNMSEAEWDGVIETHLKGTFTVFRAAAAVMRKQEGGGSLVAFTSGVGMWGSISQANYAAAKGGVVALVRSAALGLEKYGINANAVAPVASTRMQANVPGGTAETGAPEDVAPMVVYLLSDAARAVTGQTYTVVGGRVGLWAQPREIREIVKDGRWTPAELAERLPGEVGTDRLPMLDYIDMMKARAEGAESAASSTAP
jgi:NAD(P)-dependent dehydrogenase (short-subunit alcohol dehydrogenase family)